VYPLEYLENTTFVYLYQDIDWVSVVCIQESAGWFRNRFGKVPKKIREVVFGFGWDTCTRASLERHVMCSEVPQSPQSNRTIFRESQEGCMRMEVENYF